MTTRSVPALAALLLLAPAAVLGDASFTSAEQEGQPAVYLELDPESPNNELRLKVMVDGVEDLYGVSFQLRYPDRILRFEEEQTTEGDLLATVPPPADDEEADSSEDEEPAEVETFLVARRRAPKRVIVGLTRVGEEPGISGSGHLLTLVFRARADIRGRGKFRWEENDLVDSTGFPIQEVEWVKGTAVVNTVQPPVPPSPPR
ncbi:MAG: cohesin domain-containing protein [Thermoanaerobaculia bacterium]|nr:cohesin domain-containing protein [Thermoanaerobaculia bacterium]